jgi:predicted nucleic acid-binding protein
LQKANEAWERATKLLGLVRTIDDDFIKRVARWKVNSGLGLGDSFIAACAEDNAAILVTADHTDFDPIQQGALIRLEFIR